MRWLYKILLFATLLLATCCAHQSTRAVGPATAPACQCLYTYTYAIAPGFTQADQLAVLDAMRVWGTGTQGRVCWVPANMARQEPQATIRRVSRIDLAVYLPDTWTRTLGLWHAQSGTVFVVADVGYPVRTIAIHELGHVMGLRHTARWEHSLPSFMHATLDDPTMPRAPHAQLPLRDLFGFCEIHACDCRP